MRELTDSEKLFIEKNTQKREIIKSNSVKARKKRINRVFKFINLRNFSYLLFILPFLINGIFMYFILKAESLLGKENIELLSSQDISPDVIRELERFGLGDLPQYLTIYNNRGLIIAIIFTVFVVLGLIFFMIDYFIRAKYSDEGTEELND